MQLQNKRLLACADYVSKGGKAVDVGTDHAYLATFLVANGISSSAIACDINLGPLLMAKQTLEHYNLTEKIMLIESDGLKNVPDNDVSDVIIAGMGGELISEILENAKWLQRGTNIILQAMTRISYLRKWLYNNGFQIINEKAVEDEAFIYIIMQVKYEGDFIEISDYLSETGILDLTNIVVKKYLLQLSKRLENNAKGMLKSTDKHEEGTKLLALSQQIVENINGFK